MRFAQFAKQWREDCHAEDFEQAYSDRSADFPRLGERGVTNGLSSGLDPLRALYEGFAGLCEFVPARPAIKEAQTQRLFKRRNTAHDGALAHRQ